MSQTDVPELYGRQRDDDMYAHAQMHTTLLHAIHKRLEEVNIPFRIQVPAGPAGSLAVPILSAAKGEILTLHNPTNAAFIVDIFENDQGNTVLRATVPANDWKGIYVPFFGRLWARAGAGMIISGHVTGD